MSAKWFKGSSGPAGDEHHNLIADPITVAVAAPLTAGSAHASNRPGRRQEDDFNIVAEPVAEAFKPSHYTRDKDGAPSEIQPPLSADADKGDQDPVVFESRFARNGRGAPEHVCPPLKAQSGQSGKGDGAPLVFDETQITHRENRSNPQPGDPAPTIPGQGRPPTLVDSRVRRLTPLECERLQGFPDGWTDVPGASDSARYRALGNSMAVPVMSWLGKRLEFIDKL